MMQDDPGSLLELLQQHLIWYPLMELRDIYKLLYQGVMGSEHLLTSPEEYTNYLRIEFEQLQPEANQRLLEPVRPDGALFRLNLRSYKSRQQGLDSLTSFLLETTKLITGSIPEFRLVWETFVQFYLHGLIRNFDIIAIQKFNQWLDEMEYPAIHHSEVYRRAYQPAYRLISARYIPELGLTDAG